MEKPQRDLLIVELQLGHDGYKWRDQLVPQEFAYMLQVFALLLTLLTAAKALAIFSPGLTAVVLTLFGITGFIALTTFLVDIEANISSKRALRQRGAEIEEMLQPQPFRLWKTIADRQMFYEEEHFKAASRGKFEPSASTGFVWAARLFVVLWVILVVVIIFWGQVVNLRG